jgi:DUF177 domain-containing protein
MASAPGRGTEAVPTASQLDLRSLDLPAGGAVRLDVAVPAPPLTLGGQPYVPEPAEPVVRLDVSRALTGVHMRLRGELRVVGPCWRCVEEARAPVVIDTREFAAEGRDPAAPFDDDLDSPYLHEHRVDLAGWLRDAVVEALPPTILCAEGCAGLCPTCGAARAAGPCGCAEEPGDPRWAALAEVAERLRRQEG